MMETLMSKIHITHPKPTQKPKKALIWIDLEMTGLDTQTDRLKIFHAGTKQSGDAIVTEGGRVLCVTALADDIQTAQKDALAAIERIYFDGM